MDKYEEIKTTEEGIDDSWDKLSGIVSEYAEYGVRFKDVKADSLCLKLYVSVPKSSDIYDEDSNEMCGTFLAKKFKEDLLKRDIIDVPFKLFAATEDRHHTREDYEHRKELSPAIDMAIRENIDADEAINKTMIDTFKDISYKRCVGELEDLVNELVKYLAYGVLFYDIDINKDFGSFVLKVSCPKTSQIMMNGVEAAGEYIGKCLEHDLKMKGFEQASVQSYDRNEHWTFQMSVDSANGREQIKKYMTDGLSNAIKEKFYSNPDLDETLRSVIKEISENGNLSEEEKNKMMEKILSTIRQ